MAPDRSSREPSPEKWCGSCKADGGLPPQPRQPRTLHKNKHSGASFLQIINAFSVDRGL